MTSSSTLSQISIRQIFWLFLKLGLSSFGGPVAHLGYFHQCFVMKHAWLNEKEYADLIALCQLLPGPTSSQVGMALGYRQGGYRGAFAAWLGFSLPSVLILIIAAEGIRYLEHGISSGLIHGLKIVAVAVVAQAVWGMARQLCPDTPRVSIMLMACASILLMNGIWLQVSVILLAAILGGYLFRHQVSDAEVVQQNTLILPRSKLYQSAICLTIFLSIFLLIPLILQVYSNPVLALFDAFYRSGALVFGGGHVLLPLLEAEVVQSGWLSADYFLAGYALTQAMPGPLFSFAAFVGAAMPVQMPIVAAIVAVIAIFLPSSLLLFAVLPHWQSFRSLVWVRAALFAVNAAVVGILLAALYQPMWNSSILNPLDFCLALLFFVALMFWKCPVWLVVCMGGIIGYLFL